MRTTTRGLAKDTEIRIRHVSRKHNRGTVIRVFTDKDGVDRVEYRSGYNGGVRLAKLADVSVFKRAMRRQRLEANSAPAQQPSLF